MTSRQVKRFLCVRASGQRSITPSSWISRAAAAAAQGSGSMKKSTVAMALLLCFSSLMIVNTYAQQQRERDTITPDEPMNGTGSLVSPSSYFRLGFFSPGSRTSRYLGLWYNNIAVRTVVWVANRQNPILPELSSNGSREGGVLLRLDANGTLLLTNDNGTVIYWHSEGAGSASGGTTGPKSSSPVAQLLDNGNLQVRDRGAGNSILWQSFDYPSDTLLPGMKMGVDVRTGLDRRVIGWKSDDDPVPGDYSMGMDVRGVPQIILTGAGGRWIWRTGPWNGQRFSGIPEMKTYDMFNFSFVSDPSREVYYQYTTSSNSIISRLIVNSSGIAQRLVWIEGTRTWNPFWFAPKDQCDNVSPCGPFGVCDPNDAPICSCLQGFRPKSPQDWYLRDGTDGCVRVTPTDCTNGTDGFVVVSGAKLPDTKNATVVGKGSMVLDQCRAECLRNCSCTAYAAADITVPYGQSGCIIWTNELTDLRVYANGGQDLYVRLAAKDLDSSSKQQHRKKVRIILILVSVLVGVALLGWVGWARLRRIRRQKRDVLPSNISRSEHSNFKFNYNAESERGIDDLDLPLFEFGAVAVASNYFSDQNKLGEGGFGPVYKGRLEDGQDVAIKRLARNSVQGVDEFKNEVMLIAKLQHRNLVRLLGCCTQGDERMLIYEYMPNRSLDAVLFDKEKGVSLDWNARYRIIVGIARGLLYLHQDSRFRIIHRDLKASNILLDKDMTPKISDFGMARIFGGDETEANTRRVVGTYGYMSPEYAMDGIFSIKSDVFSFGVLVLEIITGMKNRGVFHAQPQQNLLGHVWSFWKDEAALKLVDKSIGESFSSFEIIKCTRIGLLCVQEHPDDRPTMSSVVLMLGSDNALLPQPKQPGFTAVRGPFEMSSSSGVQESGSVNDMSVTMIQGR